MERDAIEIESRAQWLQWRQGDITASAIGCLFDCHPYLSSEQLVGLKRGTWQQGDNPAMRRGRILEPAVIEAVRELCPDWRIEKAHTYHRLPELRLGATPDYFAAIDGIDDAVIQAKTCDPAQWSEYGGRPPLYWTLQVLVELLTTDRARGFLAVLLTSRSFPLHLFPVQRHPGAEARIIKAVEAWWRDFDAGLLTAPVDPAPIAHDLDDGSHIDLSADNELPGLLAERQDLQLRSKLDTTRLEEINDTLKAKIGKARTGYLPGWNLSYAMQRRKEFISPAKDFRVLRVTQVNEDI